jgi:molybdenum transport protein
MDDAALWRLLAEDAPYGDLTTATLGIGALPGRVSFRARAAMVVSALEHAARLFELCGAQASPAVRSGDAVAPGALLLQATGPAAGLLLAWKTAQTLVEAMSGMAGATGSIVDALAGAGFHLPVACTRKNFPGTRGFAARAVRDGGGIMHRLGLSETLLVFPEHLGFVAAADRPALLAAVRRQQPEKRLVVEAGSPADALAMARAGADVLQLERFAPAAVAALRAELQALGPHPQLAPAGGVTLSNAVDYARSGADLLVTSWPYFAPPADVKVRIVPQGA